MHDEILLSMLIRGKLSIVVEEVNGFLTLFSWHTYKTLVMPLTGQKIKQHFPANLWVTIINLTKEIITHVCHSVHEGGSTKENPLPGRAPPREQTPPQTRQTPPDQADPPSPPEQTPPRPGRHPPDQTDTPSRTRQTPPEADSSIRSTSGRYTSYWNAFLLGDKMPILCCW